MNNISKIEEEIREKLDEMWDKRSDGAGGLEIFIWSEFDDEIIETIKSEIKSLLEELIDWAEEQREEIDMGFDENTGKTPLTNFRIETENNFIDELNQKINSLIK